MTQDYAMTRVRARRRPPKPPGRPPWWPWWFSGACALWCLVASMLALHQDAIVWAAFSGALFCLNGEEAIRRWQWDRYNRWKGGGGS